MPVCVPVPVPVPVLVPVPVPVPVSVSVSVDVVVAVSVCLLPPSLPPLRPSRPPMSYRMAVHRGLEDLYGLALFLGCDPWWDKTCWTRALLRPYLLASAAALSRAHRWVAPLFWRTQKADVLDEIRLPPQIEHLALLHFTPVESHFYRKQHDECAQAARNVLLDLRRKGRETLDDRSSMKVLQQVLKLRQACCHPQVGGAGLHSIQKKVLTMEQICTQLRDKAKLECEEGQRVLVASECGLAAVSLLQNEPVVAMRHYRNVLETVYKVPVEGIRVDPLQQLHTLHNLAEVMNDSGLDAVEVGGRSVSLDELGKAQRKIRQEYCAAQNANVDACWQRLLAAEKAVGDKGSVASGWHMEALELLAGRMPAQEIVDRVEKGLYDQDSNRYGKKTQKQKERQAANQKTMIGKFTTVHGLKMLMNTRMQALWEMRGEVLARIKEQCSEPTDGAVAEAGNCGDCKANYEKKGRRCQSCQMADLLDEYKCVVFHHDAEREKRQSARREDGKSAMWWEERIAGAAGEGDRSQQADAKNVETAERRRSEAETVLRVIIKLLREHSGGGAAAASSDKQGICAAGELLEEGKVHLDVWEALVGEYNKVQILWRTQRERLEKLDELTMANQRLRFRDDGEDMNAVDQITKALIVDVGDGAQNGDCEIVRARRQELEFERADAKDKLLKARGQFKYLTNLVSAQAAAAKRKREAAAAAAEARRDGGKAGAGGGGGADAVGGGCDESGAGSAPADGWEEDGGGGEGEAVEELLLCPVCLAKDVGSNEVVMLPCGHMLCYVCCRHLMKRAVGRCTKCPTCRSLCNHRDLTYVYDRLGEGDECETNAGADGDVVGDGGVKKESDEVEVKGSYSTKIVALVRGLMSLPAGEKAIVFSEWEDMLALLSHALTANGISHRRCKGGKSISDGLKAFKQDADMRAVLLPFKSGSNGLNVIEATHVFLIEPILNVAVEAQAIGRIHRIGQDKATTVHRMIVEGTVEERVRALSKKKMSSIGAHASLELVRAAAKSTETVTIHDMEALFDSSALQTPVETDAPTPDARPEAGREDGTPAAGGLSTGGGWGGDGGARGGVACRDGDGQRLIVPASGVSEGEVEGRGRGREVEEVRQARLKRFRSD